MGKHDYMKYDGRIEEPPYDTEAFSREEMIEEAKAYMRDTWGPCRESEDRDRWHERLGMLVDFIHDRFPPNPSVDAAADEQPERTGHERPR